MKQQKKSWKRFFGLLLSLILAVGIMVEYVPTIPEVRAEEPAEESDEPVFDEETGVSYPLTSVSSPDGAYAYTYDPETGIVTVPKGATKTEFKSGLLADVEEYYYSMVIQGSTVVSLSSRGYGINDWFIQIQPSGYTVRSIDGTQTSWHAKVSFSKMRDEGLRITVHSTKNSVKAWVDGELLIDYDSEHKGEARPRIVSVSSAEATVSNIRIWRPKTESDEPLYCKRTDRLYPMTGVSSPDSAYGYIYDTETGIVTIPVGATKTGFNSKLPTDIEEYYYTMVIQGSTVVSLSSRGYGINDWFIQIQPSGYTVRSIDGTQTSWHAKTEFNKMRNEGLRVTVHSTKNSVKAWFDGELLIDYDSEHKGEARPRIVSVSSAEATVSNIQIWKTKGEEEGWYDVSTYRNNSNNFTSPEKGGKVFAGWYTDDEIFTMDTALKEGVTTGIAYAKFVDADVLQAAWQISLNAKETGKANLRLITTVDDLTYKNVGFSITFDGVSMGHDRLSTTVYERIAGWDGEVQETYLPTDISKQSMYFMTYRFDGIPSTDFEKDFEVTPVWTTLDGTRVEGSPNTFKINDDASLKGEGGQ